MKVQNCLKETSYIIPWYIMLRKEHRLSAFQNRVLCKTFRAKRDDVTGHGENCIILGRKTDWLIKTKRMR